MAFNPFNLFKGNPRVLELMSKKQELDNLLQQQTFCSQFKRNENEALANYMNYENYEQLIRYISVVDPTQAEDKNKSFKFPFVAAEILAVSNELTFRFLLQEVKFVEEEITEEIEVEKQLDSQSSDRSYSSIKSNSSINSSNSATTREKPEKRAFQESDKQNFILSRSHDPTLSDYDFDEDKQISEDDFPDVKLKKTVIVKETASRTVRRAVQPLIFKVLSYFAENTVTHILDGYVCKLLENVLNNRFEAFINLVQNYNRFAELEAIFRHIQSNSVQELLLNFIIRLIDFGAEATVSSQATLIGCIQDVCLQEQQEWHLGDLPLQDRVNYLHLYSLIIDKLAGKMKEREGEAKQANRELTLMKELKILATIISKQHIEQLISIMKRIVETSKTHNQHSQTILPYLKILRSVLNCFLQLRELRSTQNSIQREQLIQIKEIVLVCEDVFDRVIIFGLAFTFEDYLFWDQQAGKKFKPRHSLAAKIEFLDIIAKLVQENIYFSKRTILDCSPFEHILELLDLYPSSSMFHNSIMKSITPFFNTDIDVITLNKFFRKQKMLSFIHQTVKEDYQIRYQVKKTTRKCYIAQITAICLLIQKLNREECDQLTKYKQSEQWSYIHECLVQEEQGTRNQFLGGLQKQVQKQSIIFFSKNDCLNHFKYFLSGKKYNLFDQLENYEPGNSDSQDESNDKKMIAIEKLEDKILEETIDQSKYFDENIDL